MEKELTLFDYVNLINYGKASAIETGRASGISAYVPFMVNRALSQNADTALLANEMNRSYHLDPVLQFDFLSKTVRKQKRFGKWAKKETDGSIKVIMDYYSYSYRQALQVKKLFSKEKISEMLTELNVGGKVSGKKDK